MIQSAAFHNEGRLRKILRGLYDEQQTDDLMVRLAAVLEEYRPALSARRNGPGAFTEKDVLLITYPDQVRQSGSPPLAVLSDFCRTHFRDLLSIVHILPFYPSSSDDGFSVVDYRSVDPDLGGWSDVSRLGEDFQLMLDAVINHASARSVWFQGFLRDEESYRGYFIETQDQPALARVVRPRTTPLLHRFEGSASPKTVWTTFSGDQADLNYRNPRVLLEMADLLFFYAAHGASIVRLDAVGYLWKEIGTSCINLPQTHRIVRFFRAVLEEAAPWVRLVTETNVPQGENFSYFGDGGSEAHLIYNFALPPMVMHTLLSGDPSRLARWVDELPIPGGRSAYLNFLASHDGIGLNAVRDILPQADVDRLIRATLAHGGRISEKRNPDGGAEPYELNINFFDALSDPESDESPDLQTGRFLAAHAILLGMAGVPAIYFHSLVGSRSWTAGVEQTGRNRAINRLKFDRADLERQLAEESGLRHMVFSGMERLIRARKRSPAFDPYGIQKTAEAGEGIFALLRIHSETGCRAFLLQNVTGWPVPVEWNPEALPMEGPNSAAADLISGRQYSLRQLQALRLDPYQTCWLVLRGGDPPH